MADSTGRCMVIAEAGVNHNGSLDMARRLVDAAAAAGADAVKFQTFKAEKLTSRNAPKAAYQQETTDPSESQLGMIRSLELSEDMHRCLIDHASERGIAFLSTPFDLESLELLHERFKLPRLKLPSGEITNALLLVAAARTGLPIILSTGMSTLGEVEQALSALAFGYLGDGAPAPAAFDAAYRSDAGQRILREKVALLHCTTEYPAPFHEINLRAMQTLHCAFGLPVGFSDHSEGIALPIAAVSLGAVVIEKHFTLDKSLPGPDHKASLDPDELLHMVRGIRQVEAARGDGIKRPVASELANRDVVRKSLVAMRPISKGELFDSSNVTVKRPGTGISPFCYWDVIGRPADKDYAADELIGAP
ncbi:MAG TPA: N-acetylneuraminate synthase [Methylococcaceae bacterium]|nr:N-acetylneuraminate synthase [Methylococcaceae bacterium]